jgi:hypothetical protein
MEALGGGRGGIAPTHSRPRHYMGVSGQCHAPKIFYKSLLNMKKISHIFWVISFVHIKTIDADFFHIFVSNFIDSDTQEFK